MSLSAEDRCEIEETLVRYCHGLAERDPQAAAAVFSQDAILEIGYSNAGTFASRVEGREGILQWAREVANYIVALQYVRIWTSKLLTESDGQDLKGRTFFQALGCDGAVVASGVFSGRFRKERGVWKISHLRCVNDGSREEIAAREALLVARMHPPRSTLQAARRFTSAEAVSGPKKQLPGKAR